MHSSLARVIRFGVFEADVRTGELRKRGMRIKLQDQPFQILAMLLESPGDVVTREEMHSRIWPDGTFVDFEHGLNKAINKLREALGDSAAHPRYIETLSRRGYRFIAPVAGRTAIAESADRTTEQRKTRLLVLPFENLGPDAQEEYFSDGLTEEVISQLGQLHPSRLGVIARTSAMQYKHTSKQVAEIGEELKVDYVLEGSVRKSGTRARITAQLIEVAGQTHLWAASYDRELADIFAVQNEVVCCIARSLAVELLPERRREHRARSFNPAAYEAYLRGRFSWAQRSDTALQSAIGFFEQALEIEPQFAPAHVGIAEASVLLPWFGAADPHDAAARAREAALRALQLDATLAEAHCSLALLRFWYDWDWEGADHEFQHTIELSPNYSTVHHWYCAYLVAMGRFDEAIHHQKLAEELDPFSLIIANAAGHVYLYSSRFDEAIAVFQSVIARDRAFLPAHFNLGQAYLCAGKYGEAIESLERVAQLSQNRGALAALAHACACSGDALRARAILLDMKPVTGCDVSAPLVAVAHFALGDTDRGFEWLEKGFNERSYWMTLCKVDPSYNSVRRSARFRKLLRLLNFESAAARLAA